MKTTYGDVINFVNAASRWTAFNSKESPTKLSYAVARMLKRCDKPVAKFNDDLEDLRIDNCLTDEKTHAILRDEQQNYKFTKEGLKTVSDGRRKLLDEEVEIEPYIATEIPDDLRDDARIAFEEFVIPAAPSPD